MYSNRYSELYHHGIKGQHWGERRWQNPDGSLTPAGYAHYGYKGGNIKIKKGEKVYRMSLSPKADTSKKNIRNMYVSPTKEDNETWKKYFRPYYGNEQKQIKFKTKKDLNVASQEDLAKATEKSLHSTVKQIYKTAPNENTREAWINQIEYKIDKSIKQTKRIEQEYYNNTGQKIKINPKAVLGAMIISREGNEDFWTNNITHQLVKSGKDAVMDVWGLDVAKAPVIILNPGEKTKPSITSLLKTGKYYREQYSRKENKNTKIVRQKAKQLSV